MRIGIITHNYPATSIERKDAGIFLFDFAHQLARRHDVFILCPNFRGKKEKYTIAPVTWFPWKGGDSKLGDFKITSVKSFLQFISLIKEGRKAAVKFVNKNKLDYILAAWALPSGDFAYIAHKKTGVAYATWSLGSDINKYVRIPVLRQIIVRSLKNADTRFANSYALTKQVASLTDLLCEFLPAITNFSKKHVQKKKRNSIFIFLYLGRLELVKGPDILLEAVRLLPSRIPWRVVIGGDGSMDADLKAYVKANSLENKVEFLGRLSEKEVAKAMHTSACLVVPSRSESMPLVIIEAARSELPVIATDVGDCKRIIQKYNIGLVALPQDAKSLSSQMKKALTTKKFSQIYRSGLRQLSEDFQQKKAVAILEQYAKKTV